MIKKKCLYFWGIFLISNTLISQTCVPTFVPDLPLQQSSTYIQSEIDNIYNNAKTRMLAGSAPSVNTLNDAITSYENLNISVTGSVISGNPISSYDQVAFIGIFSDYLKFNPSDTIIKEKARKTIWWVYENVCNNTLPPDTRGYIFRNFGRKAAFCLEFLDNVDKQRFLYIMEKNSQNWNVFWKANLSDGEFDSDFIFNNLDTLIPTLKCFPTSDEQYRYLLTLKRYVKRFASEYTDGTKDGMKPDGTGYHHWNNYQAYMYAYNTVIEVMKMIKNTSFQLDIPAYLNFRDAVMHKQLTASDNDLIPLSMTGRSGNWDDITMSSYLLKDLANIGGEILGLSTADPILAGLYNRKYGPEASFNYSAVTPFETGFYQINHHNAAVFRTKNCVVFNKGFNNQLWGSEIYTTSNRYGRYQSYGALSVVYPGNRDANGFNTKKWNWNYNPGATTKVLPWDKLIAGWDRIDELSNKRFVGSLQFNLQNKGVLNKVLGTYGIFAMDFQERTNLGFLNVTAPDTHDPSFTFKKSSFFFDDVIICLASNISNSDSIHNTVTTLYQNSTNPANVVVNDNIYSLTETTTNYSMVTDNWVLDNFGTGYYVVAGDGNLKIQRKNQQIPSQDQINPTILNPAAQAAIGFIDHGSAPSELGYEYVVFPATSIAAMKVLAASFQSVNTKPYEVINKTENSHIIKHKSTKAYGFALFSANTLVPGNTNITSNDFPCLIMYQPNLTNTQMKLSLANPDLGLPGSRSLIPFTPKTIRLSLNGNWQLSAPHPDITFVSFSGNVSVYDFKTYQGLPIEAVFKINSTTLSSEEIHKKKESIEIYPNPASDKLYVRTDYSPFLKWKINDNTGKIVMDGEHRVSPYEFEIRISHLPSGLYIFSSNITDRKFKFLKK